MKEGIKGLGRRGLSSLKQNRVDIGAVAGCTAVDKPPTRHGKPEYLRKMIDQTTIAQNQMVRIINFLRLKIK